MEKLLKKLHSQRGETMLMALLLFLVGVMVSAVILAAAISAESDAKGAREEQQAYLTVSSAAELFRDAIQSGSGGYREIVTEGYQSNHRVSLDTQKQEATGPFCEIFNQLVPKLLTAPTTFAKTYTLSMADMEDVTMELTIQPRQDDNAKFTLTAVFHNDLQGKHPCQMTVTFGGEIAPIGTSWHENGILYHATTTQIRWSGASITRPRTQPGD